jgi:amidophosphoribosyltransferase
MCSIGGFITTKKHSRFAQEKFAQILTAGEVRGTDACGIAFNTGKNRFYFMKAPKPASEFIKEEVYKDLIGKCDPTLIIGHNRARTQGDQKDNKNNHPIITKTGLSLIHNGMISNDAEIAKEFNLTLDGQVDSEVIVRMIEYYIYTKGFDTIKAIQLTAQKLKGGLAFALLNAKEPNTAYLLASSNPLTLAFHKPTGTVFWASTDDILRTGLIEFDYYFKGFFKKAQTKDDYVFQEIDDDTGIKLTARGWKMFSVTRPTYQYSSYNRADDTPYSPENKAIDIYIPAKKPVIIEAKGEAEIQKALQDQLIGFDEYDTIDKPSNYMSELLLMRLEAIQDLVLTDQDFDYYGEKGITDIKTEVRRIIDTLKFRQKKTEREIYIPTVDEILVFRETDGEFENIAWVLASKNKDLFDSIETAKEEEIENSKIDALAKLNKQDQIPFD